jgi:hypothetical protein
MSDESVLVDQVVAGERLNESRPAVGEEVFPWLALEPRDLVREVAAEDRCITQSPRWRVFENTTLGISFIGAA